MPKVSNVASAKPQFGNLFQSSDRQSLRAIGERPGAGWTGSVFTVSGRISALGPARAICPSIGAVASLGATVVVVDQPEVARIALSFGAPRESMAVGMQRPSWARVWPDGHDAPQISTR